MSEKMVYVCPMCGSVLEWKGMFCPECGARLNVEPVPESEARKNAPKKVPPVQADPNPMAQGGLMGPGFMPALVFNPQTGCYEPARLNAKPVVSDPEVENVMLVDYCSKVLNTGAGSRYDEMVLARAVGDGTLQIDEYTKGFTGQEIHKLYKVPEEALTEVMKFIGDNHFEGLVIPPGAMGGMCGGEVVVKFRKEDGTYCRVTSGSIEYGKMNLLYSVGSILGKYLGEAKAARQAKEGEEAK